MRVVIVTDSLGLPREGISLENTWTEKILKEFAGNENIHFYTIMRPGLTTKYILFDCIKEWKPDVVIIEYGINDALRRGMSLRESMIISHIPIVNSIVHSFMKKHHYYMTKIRNVHYGSSTTYMAKIKEITEYAKVYYIPIVLDHEYYESKTFNTREDVAEYNGKVKSLESDRLVYAGIFDNNVKEYLLNDGMHLNLNGEERVYEYIKTSLIEEMNIRGL